MSIGEKLQRRLEEVAAERDALAEKLAEEMRGDDDLRDILDRVKEERDALAAYVERIQDGINAVRSLSHATHTKQGSSYSEQRKAWSQLNAALGDAPTTSLARLKAEWQADILHHLMHEALIQFDDWEKEVKPLADELRRQAEANQ